MILNQNGTASKRNKGPGFYLARSSVNAGGGRVQRPRRPAVNAHARDSDSGAVSERLFRLSMFLASQDCYSAMQEITALFNHLTVTGKGNLDFKVSRTADLEQGRSQRSDMSGQGSVCFSDVEDGSCYSHFYSTNGGSYDEHSFACDSDPDEVGVVHESGRGSCVSECSVEVEIESGVPEIKVHLGKAERDCRICHMGLESESHESGVPIELGCSCKDDLAAAHKNCAETWFKIKGNRTCEICHSVARNVYGANEETTENLSDSNNATAVSTTSAPATPETRRFWHGHRFLNFLLACMVFAFVISWLFHFNVPSS
ncbi:C4HC3 zinc-finger like motif-containing protein [Senna tora]|uniref:C4HC3 zinc-finger like motif-containing protein n=1 Tax=Senna tora TaxID=362788 RepID=A0A834TRF6_9FABA|nr:C4HC3 zinc-finger like motif-containing protein [Senna tora]